MGALPIVLALGTAGFRDGPPWRAWMTAVALVSLWAAVGEFAGPTRWSVAEPTPRTGDDSFYGLLAACLPGFRLFRLPFKLLAFTTLALSALAGLGWDRIAAGAGRRRVLVLAIGLLGITVATLASAASQRERIVAAIAAQESNHAVFGPLVAPAAVGDMLVGLGHGAISLTVSLVVIAVSWRRTGPAGVAALALVTADLAIANAPLVIAIPQADFERESAVVRAIREVERADPSPGPFRVQRLPSWVPIGWGQAGSADRLRELVDWEIDTLQPKFGLLHGFRYVFADESETGRADYRRLFRPDYRVVDPPLAAALGAEPSRPLIYHPRRMFDLWGARYFIIPSYPGDWSQPNRSYAALVDQTDLIYPDPVALEGPDHVRERQQWVLTRDVQVRRNRAAFPRAWVVHSAHLIRPLPAGKSTARDALIARLRSADPQGQADPQHPPTDLRATAYIETRQPASLAPYLLRRGAGPPDPTESVAVREDSSTRMVIETRLERPGIVILADTFDPGWRLSVDGIPAPVLRVNLLMRGAAVAAGSHTLVYRYEPASVRIGVGVSVAGLAALAALALWSHPARSPRPSRIHRSGAYGAARASTT
jgi:hypothetical protein